MGPLNFKLLKSSSAVKEVIFVFLFEVSLSSIICVAFLFLMSTV